VAIDRVQEIKRRRHRRKKLAILARKLKTAKHSETQVIKEKLRKLTPGADVIIQNWKIDQKS
jgi:hypothetical protein